MSPSKKSSSTSQKSGSKTTTKTDAAQAKYKKGSQRSVGQMTISNDRNYKSIRALTMQAHEHEEYSEFFYKPHTLISLAILLALLFFMVQTNFLENFAATISLSNEENKAKSTLSGEFKRNGALIGVCIAFVAFGSIHLPNTLMTRPHPLFWRALLAVFTLYAMFITYLFLLPLDEARTTLKIFDQDLGK